MSVPFKQRESCLVRDLVGFECVIVYTLSVYCTPIHIYLVFILLFLNIISLCRFTFTHVFIRRPHTPVPWPVPLGSAKMSSCFETSLSFTILRNFPNNATDPTNFLKISNLRNFLFLRFSRAYLAGDGFRRKWKRKKKNVSPEQCNKT